MITCKRAFIRRCVFVFGGSLLAIFLFVSVYMHIQLCLLSQQASKETDIDKLNLIFNKMDDYGFYMAHNYSVKAFYQNSDMSAKTYIMYRATSATGMYPWDRNRGYALAPVLDNSNVCSFLIRIMEEERNSPLSSLAAEWLVLKNCANPAVVSRAWRTYLEVFTIDFPSDTWGFNETSVALSYACSNYSRDAWDWFFRHQNRLFKNETTRTVWRSIITDYFDSEKYSISPTTLRMVYRYNYKIIEEQKKEGNFSDVDFEYLLKEDAGHYLRYPFTDTGTDEDAFRYNQYFHQILVPQHKEENSRRSMLFYFLYYRFEDKDMQVWNAIMADMKTHWKLVRDRYLTIDQIAEWVEKHPRKYPPKPSTEDVVLPWETHIPGIKQ